MSAKASDKPRPVVSAPHSTPPTRHPQGSAEAPTVVPDLAAREAIERATASLGQAGDEPRT